MTYMIEGRIGKAKEKTLRIIDRADKKERSIRVCEAPRSRVPHINGLMSKNPTGYLKPKLKDVGLFNRQISLEQMERHFTREYEPHFYQPQLLETLPSVDKTQRKADWPVFAEAMAGTLLSGRDDSETGALNLHAVWLMRELRRLTDLTEQQEKHDRTEDYDGFGHDSLSDLGPSPEMLIQRWIGSDPMPAVGTERPKSLPRFSSKKVKSAWENRTGAVVDEHWPAGEFVLAPSKAITQRVAFSNGFEGVDAPVHCLRSVGDLQFDASANMTKYSIGVDRNGAKIWLPFLDRSRASKGSTSFQNRIKAEKKRQEQERNKFLLSKSYAPEIDGKVAFLAGAVAPSFIGNVQPSNDVADMQSIMDPDGETTFHRQPQSSHDPVMTEQATEQSQDFASEALDHYRRVMGSIPFDAMVNAAMGMRLDECGDGPLHNRQASARGRDRIKIAVTNFIGYEYEVEPLLLSVAA